MSRGFLISAVSGAFVEVLKMAEREPLEREGWLLAQWSSFGAEVLAGVAHGLFPANGCRLS